MHYKCLSVTVGVILLGSGIYNFYVKLIIATEVIQENTGETNATCNVSLTHAVIKIVFLDSITICVSSKAGYLCCLM